LKYVYGNSIETIRSPGLSHLSYLIGHQGHAAVIDPRRDCHVYVGELLDNLHRIPKEKNTVTFCGSVQRAVIAATILKREGYENIANSLGSMAACSAVGCPVIQGEE
jgi:rhodanese-related sulfurtransferase